MICNFGYLILEKKFDLESRIQIRNPFRHPSKLQAVDLSNTDLHSSSSISDIISVIRGGDTGVPDSGPPNRFRGILKVILRLFAKPVD